MFNGHDSAIECDRVLGKRAYLGAEKQFELVAKHIMHAGDVQLIVHVAIS